MDRIERANTLKELTQIRNELTQFRVLDPACGSGNFLYLSFRELVRVEMMLLAKARAQFNRRDVERELKIDNANQPKQFFGIDRDMFGVELAKVTLMLAKKLAIDEALEMREAEQFEMLDSLGPKPFPLTTWTLTSLATTRYSLSGLRRTPSSAIHRFSPRTRCKQNSGAPILQDCMARTQSARFGGLLCLLVPTGSRPPRRWSPCSLGWTNTIRQNYSREGSLDYIVSHGGTITEAVSSQVWSGDAVVHVSIVNWIKGPQEGKKRLFIQDGGLKTGTWRVAELDRINTALSFDEDITQAKSLRANAQSGACFQGQTHGHEAFILSPEEAKEIISEKPRCTEIIFPYLIADDLLGTISPSRVDSSLTSAATTWSRPADTGRVRTDKEERPTRSPIGGRQRSVRE